MCWGSILPLEHYGIICYHILLCTRTKENINCTKSTTEPQHLPTH